MSGDRGTAAAARACFFIASGGAMIGGALASAVQGRRQTED